MQQSYSQEQIGVPGPKMGTGRQIHNYNMYVGKNKSYGKKLIAPSTNGESITNPSLQFMTFDDQMASSLSPRGGTTRNYVGRNTQESVLGNWKSGKKYTKDYKNQH